MNNLLVIQWASIRCCVDELFACSLLIDPVCNAADCCVFVFLLNRCRHSVSFRHHHGGVVFFPFFHHNRVQHGFVENFIGQHVQPTIGQETVQRPGVAVSVRRVDVLYSDRRPGRRGVRGGDIDGDIACLEPLRQSHCTRT